MACRFRSPILSPSTPSIAGRAFEASTPELGSLAVLPAELRNAIFELVLIQEESQIWPAKETSRAPGLLATSKTIRIETLPMYYLRNTVCAHVRLRSLDKFHQYLEILVGSFSQMGLERCTLRIAISTYDDHHPLVKRTRDDVLFVIANAARITKSCCEKGFVVNRLRRPEGHPGVWCVDRLERLDGDVPAWWMVTFFRTLLIARVMGHRAFVEGWTDDHLQHHVEESVAIRFANYLVLQAFEHDPPSKSADCSDISSDVPFCISIMEGSDQWDPLAWSIPDNVWHRKVAVRYGRRMVRLGGDGFFGNLDDERLEHCSLDLCVDAMCWHRSFQGKPVDPDEAFLDFIND